MFFFSAHIKTKDKYTGCMLGAAIGDALGKQNEGLRRSDIRRRAVDYAGAHTGSPGEKLRAGQYTDDTEQMIVLARSIIECGSFDIEDFAIRIAEWGAGALADPVRKSLVGPSSRAAIVRLNSGVSWRESGSDIPSCGSAMRVAPVGLFYKDMDEVESNAALSSLPTHNSKGAIAGAVAVAVGVRCAILDMECSDIIKETCSRASKYDEALAGKIELSYRRRDEEPDEAFAELGTSYFVYETVPAAFYCFSRHFDSPQKAVIEAVNAGGDTDSIACITGALCGAGHGAGAFPKRWLEGLENRELIENLAEMILEISVR
ncbi:MAG: ADP-ribosylglycohydrolase family protein [Candidatus Methanoperedens sp.]|nr:ADP-ribosylglycohydrolase family protein [Candidatus Methanoperedens sp.]